MQKWKWFTVCQRSSGVPTVSSSLRELVLDIDHNAALVVIHTGPGAAQLIARLLDSR